MNVYRGEFLCGECPVWLIVWFGECLVQHMSWWMSSVVNVRSYPRCGECLAWWMSYHTQGVVNVWRSFQLSLFEAREEGRQFSVLLKQLNSAMFQFTLKYSLFRSAFHNFFQFFFRPTSTKTIVLLHTVKKVFNPPSPIPPLQQSKRLKGCSGVACPLVSVSQRFWLTPLTHGQRPKGAKMMTHRVQNYDWV